MKPDLREILATAISLIVPILWMGIRWFSGIAAFPAYLAGLMLMEATVQAWLIGLARSDRLTPRRYRLLFFTAGLILGMPATIVSVYMGIVPEFRLLPFFFLVLERYGRAQAIYAFALFMAGILLFFPFLEGKAVFLALELFRPVMGLGILFVSFHFLEKHRKNAWQKIRKIRNRKAPV